MPELVNFGHNPLLEAMLTFATWQGGFSSSDKRAMATRSKRLEQPWCSQPAPTPTRNDVMQSALQMRNTTAR